MLLPRSLVRPAIVAWFLCLLCFLYLASFMFSDASVVSKQYRKLTDFAAEWRKPTDPPSHHLETPPTDAGKTAPSPSEVSDTEFALATETSSQNEPSRPTPGDKIIVMGRLQHEDTSWVQEHLPDWENAIYTVDNTSAPLHTMQNKGREANPYLLYIIQHYDKLPSTIAFLHSHRDGWPGGWHTDVDGYDNVVSMNTLNLDFVQRNGYVNLRCNWVPGCPDEMQYLRESDNDDPKNVEHRMEDVWHHFFGNSTIVPEVIATPCCAQFAVSREQVLARPLDDYEKFHQWLMDTPLSDDTSGRIMEYLWHVIFGRDAVYCPDMGTCYRDVYGKDIF